MVHLIIITGLSGSGKSTAKKCFEDVGYFTIDNLPVPLVHEFLRLLIHANEGIKKIAMVMDARIGEFINQAPAMLEQLRQRGYQIEMIYLDASDEALNRRFSETRRKHPLSPNESPSVGIAKEREILKLLREKSDLVIDTSEFNTHQLKQLLLRRYEGKSGNRNLAVRITSFGYRYGIPRDADLVFDVRFLPNPFFKDQYRDLNGLDTGVRDFVIESELGKEFKNKIIDLIDYLIPLYQNEGKAYLNIAFGCTAGKHRSVAIGHLLMSHLEKKSYPVQIEDRDIQKTER
jgi:UPF0042 nucleotide-binding protein